MSLTNDLLVWPHARREPMSTHAAPPGQGHILDPTASVAFDKAPGASCPIPPPCAPTTRRRVSPRRDREDHHDPWCFGTPSRRRQPDARQAWPRHGRRQRSFLAWGIASACAAQGAELAFTFQGDALERRVRPGRPNRLGSGHTLRRRRGAQHRLGIRRFGQTLGQAGLPRPRHGYADKNLRGRYLDTPRAAFLQAMDIS